MVSMAMHVCLSIPLTWDFSLNRNPMKLVARATITFNSPYLGFLFESVRRDCKWMEKKRAFNSPYLGFLFESCSQCKRLDRWRWLSIPLTWDFSLNLEQCFRGRIVDLRFQFPLLGISLWIRKLILVDNNCEYLFQFPLLGISLWI